MTETDEETGGVGVITAIEDIDGTMMDASDIDADTRDRWIDDVTATLEQMAGVETAWGAGNTHLNNQTGQFEVELVHSEPRWKDGVVLDTNLRSFAQRLRSVFESNPRVSSYDVTMKPESLGDERHDHAAYVVEFYLV